MSVQSEILAQTKTRANKQSNLAERGRWNSTNSGAFLRGPRADKGIGQKEKATANFLGALIGDIMPLSIDKLKETRKEEVNFGKASWAKATKEQREKWSNAIKNGYAFEGDSPYFRQGVAIAYTESLASKYAQDLSQGYEAWTKKNDPKSGSFDEWINSEDEKFQPQFENIDDDVLNEYFIPMQDQVRDRLRSMHTNRLNENYKTESYYTKQNQIFSTLRNFFDSVYEEGTDSTMGFGALITRGKEANQQNVETLTIFQGLLEKKNPTKKDFMKLPNGQAMWDQYSNLSSKKEKKNKKEIKEVSVKDDMSDVNLTTKFRDLGHVAEVLNATPEEIEQATRSITSSMGKGKFTSYKGKTYDDLHAIHPGNWSVTQTGKIVEAIRFFREGKVKSGS